jgi:dGTP triphosphohydrolase
MEERFLFLCNNILDFIFSPPVNYTSIPSIINHYLGKEITISQVNFNYIQDKTFFFRESYQTTKEAINYLLNLKKTDEFLVENMCYAESEYFQVIGQIEELQAYLKEIRDTYWETICYSPKEQENTLKGTRWIKYLFDVYLKYGGMRGVSSAEFLNSIKENWSRLEDEETLEIGHITDNILGGISIENISNNLNNWLINNVFSIDNRHKNVIKLRV